MGFYSKPLFSLLITLFVFLATLPLPVQAADLLRVGCYDLKSFVHVNEAGTYEGYGAEYLNMLSRYSGCKFTITVAPNDELLRMLNEGELDLLMPVEMTPERRDQYCYTSLPLGEQAIGLYTLKERADLFYEDYSGLANLRIGSVKNTFPAISLQTYAKEHAFTYREMLYPDLASLNKALTDGYIDAVCRSCLGNIPDNYRLIGITSISPFYLVAPLNRANGPIKDIDAAMKLFQYDRPDFIADLHAKYLQNNQSATITNLSREELAFLQEHHTISIAIFPNRYPIAYKNFTDGTPDGILKNILDMIAAKTGLSFVYHFVPPDTNLTTYLRSGKTDLVAGLVNTDEILANYALNVSEGLVPTVTAISGLKGQVFEENTHYKIVVPATDESTLSHIKKLHPQFTLITRPTPIEAMRAVKNGEANATMQNSIILSALLQHPEFSSMSLWYTANEEGKYAYCVAERSTFDPRLISIINKGLRSLSRNELQDIILRQEASIDEETTWQDYVAKYAVALPVTILLILAILAGLYYNSRSRQRHLRQLEKNNAELRHANALANSAMEESRQANAAKSDFLARMSHDIRTPLNGVIGMTGLAREKNKDVEIDSFLGKIDVSSHYLLDLVNDILDLSKINAGKMELHPEPYTQGEFFQYLSSVINPMCQAKEITFTVKLPNFKRTLVVDKLKLNQIFFNLLSNAVKFTPNGGQVRLETLKYSLCGSVLSMDFAIADTGVGMSEDFQQKLFQPFEQELPVGTGSESGTGLGLSITQKLIQLLGGTITVTSTPGKGTTFLVHLELPSIAAQSEPADKNLVPPPISLQGKLLLVAEDNLINAEILTRLLIKYGARTLLAHNGAEAIKLFKEHPAVDAILMDVRMPVLDGKEATRQIRRLPFPQAQTVPIIAATANAYDEDIDACLAAGMNAHVAKPIEPAVLLKTLQNCF